jgi:hypothetical protein
MRGQSRDADIPSSAREGLQRHFLLWGVGICLICHLQSKKKHVNKLYQVHVPLGEEEGTSTYPKAKSRNLISCRQLVLRGDSKACHGYCDLCPRKI